MFMLKTQFLISLTTYLAGDLDAAAGRAPALHHLGPLPLLPPPPRHHHLLHHPHLHHGSGQCGKWKFLATTYILHEIISFSSPANGRQRQAVRMGKNRRSKATGSFRLSKKNFDLLTRWCPLPHYILLSCMLSYLAVTSHSLVFTTETKLLNKYLLVLPRRQSSFAFQLQSSRYCSVPWGLSTSF